MLRAAVCLVSIVTVGCAVDANGDELLCQDASDHLAACLGTDLAATSTCAPEDAQAILDEDCDGLTAKLLDQKSDFFDDYLARIGCRLGVFHLCDTPVCEPELDEPVHELDETIPVTASACLTSALAFEGCGACDYYSCREEQAGCGSDGYLLRFAHRYCNRYRLVSEPRMSEEANGWLRRVRRCLIVSLDAEAPSNDDCAAIEDAGFETHASCYVETGFCELPVRDWIGVLNTIDPGDLRFRDMFVTGHSCLREWLGTR